MTNEQIFEVLKTLTISEHSNCLMFLMGWFESAKNDELNKAITRFLTSYGYIKEAK